MTGHKAVGHAGTLDPLASGVLVILIGKATALSGYAMAGRKTYGGDIVLGVATTTDDAEGEISRVAPVPNISATELVCMLQEFVGQIEQLPPRYSAIKQQGQRAYSRSRAGKDVHLAPRSVTIYSLHVERWAPPRLRITVQTAPGTYIRSLARDIGEQLGSAGYLHSLVRLRSGDFSIGDAVLLEDLRENGVMRYMKPTDSVVRSLPAAVLDAEDTRRARHGGAIQLSIERGPNRFIGNASGMQSQSRLDGVRPTHIGSGEQSRHDRDRQSGRKIDGTGSDPVIRLYGSEGEFIGLARPEREAWHPFKVLEPLS